jgi:putative flippase GtrA
MNDQPGRDRRWRRWLRELGGFGVVGLAALVTRVGVFDLLIHLRVGPLTANVLALVLSTALAYAGNRYVSFGHRRGARAGREATLFAAVNAATFTFSELLLATAYLFDAEHDWLVVNLLNLVGICIGSAVRFVVYRRYVFVPGPRPAPEGLDQAARSVPADPLS